jgi:hypothetical protein
VKTSFLSAAAASIRVPALSIYEPRFLEAHVTHNAVGTAQVALTTASELHRPNIFRHAWLLSLLLGCVSARSISAQDQVKPEDQKIKKAFYSSKDRLTAMHAAALFVPKAVPDADIMQGPEQNKHQFQLHPNDKVICDFTTPGSKMGGKTPKFECKITSVVSANGQVQTLTPDIKEEPVKVKFGGGDNEVFAEIVATRLMWALGYYADSWFPVQVECHNCPENPISGSGTPATRTYVPANIVRKFSWHKMTEAGKDDEGWSWKELETANGRPTYERDGLKLLAVFMQHSDNKPPQQRLTCHDPQVDSKTQPPSATCDKSVMLVQDVGATFGGGGWFTSNSSAKMNLKEWSNKKLWNSAGTEGAPKPCQGALRKSLAATNGLNNPNISEEGRRFDADLMCQLSDRQIEDLFKIARVAEQPQYHNKDGSFKPGVDEASVVKQWVEAFKQKREDLAKARCEWKEKPADLAAVDNPMSLATVPNYCASKPF